MLFECAALKFVRLPCWIVAVTVVVVFPIVVVIAVALDSAIGNAHGERLLQTEGDDGVARNSDGSSLGLSAVDGADNAAYDAVIMLGLDALGPCFGRVAHAVHANRVYVKNHVVIAREADHEFDVGATGNGKMAVVAANILIDDAPINAVVAFIDIDGLICPYRDYRPGDEGSDSVAIPVMVTVTVRILGCGQRWKTES